MQYQNYIIKYTLKSKDGHVIKSGAMKAKNKLSEFEAKVKFEDFLKAKYPDFGQLIIHECNLENPLNDIFGDIFGWKNPFR